jgi:60 kDa SS-A/Ro ribonucleoprotein
MARTNTPASVTPKFTHEGAVAFPHLKPIQELRRTVMACLLWEDTFYESGQAVADRIAALVPQCKPVEVAALAFEARTAMKLRHAPLWLIRHLAKGDTASRAEVADALAQCIQRPDELTEFLSLYWKGKRAPLAASVKRGLARAFTKFNAYQLAKYNRDDAVKLRDVLFLCHAKPKDEEQAATWKALIDGTLPAPDTWEVALSAGADKKATWERLVAEEKLGGLALLRNLRNMEQAGVSRETIKGALAAMKTGRILPFRFVAAARYAPTLEPELEQAMFRCLTEQPKLGGKTILLVDVSGSMDAPLFGKSDLMRLDAAAALGMLLREVCADVQIITFSNQAVLIPARRGFALRDAITHSQPHGGTYTEQAKAAADARGYDRIIILTDEQSHQAITAPKGRGYVVNVASDQNGIGYGPWTHVDGWSEAILDYIRTAETEAT